MRFNASEVNWRHSLPMEGSLVVAEGTEQFCFDYVRIASNLLDPSTMRLEPMFWGDDRGGDDCATRIRFRIDDEPQMFKAISPVVGRAMNDLDNVVIVRDLMLDLDPGLPAMLPVVIQDAASVLADEIPAPDALGWTGSHLLRAAAAALMTVAAAGDTTLLPGCVQDIDEALEAVRSGAFRGMVSARKTRPNAEVLLAREYPGLATCLDRTVSACRLQQPMSLPLDTNVLGMLAMRVLEKSVADLPGRFNILSVDPASKGAA